MTPCRWKGCGGWMKEIAYSYQDRFFTQWICGKCGRSDDLALELRVEKEQRKPHRNWQTYQTVQVRKG